MMLGIYSKNKKHQGICTLIYYPEKQKQKRGEILPDKLVSVIILSYNNFNFLFSALQSVFMQDYGRIELIISDDSSYDFNREILDDFIYLNKSDNIENVIINFNRENLGTVKNLNVAYRLAAGDILAAFAADDMIADKHVITNIVRAFALTSDDEYIITTQVSMCDRDMNHIFSFTQSRTIELLQNGDNKLIFQHLCKDPYIPACGTFYKREVLEKHGFCDESYFLVEDWPRHLKLVRDGEKIRYFDIVTFLHRDGGVSKGNATKNDTVLRKYHHDLICTMEREILPYMDDFSENLKETITETYKKFKKDYETITKKKSLFAALWSRRYKYREYIGALIKKILDKIYPQAISLFCMGFAFVLFGAWYNFTPAMEPLKYILSGIGLVLMLVIPLLWVCKSLINMHVVCKYWKDHMKTQPISTFIDTAV